MLVELHTLLPPGRLAKQQPQGKLDFWVATFRLLEETTLAASLVRYELEEKAGWDAEALEAERERARGLRGDEAAGGAAEDGQGGGWGGPGGERSGGLRGVHRRAWRAAGRPDEPPWGPPAGNLSQAPPACAQGG